MLKFTHIYNDMIGHFTPLLASIKTMFGYKSTSLFGVSLFTAFSLEALMEILNIKFLGVSFALLLIIFLFIVIDWLTGTAASNKFAREAVISESKEDYEKYKIKSTKVSFTIFKFISLYLWLLLSHGVTRAAINNGFTEGTLEPGFTGLGFILRIFTVVPVLLFGFREFISIGENIKNLYGKVPYLFTLAEKVFDLLQLKFLDKFK